MVQSLFCDGSQDSCVGCDGTFFSRNSYMDLNENRNVLFPNIPYCGFCLGLLNNTNMSNQQVPVYISIAFSKCLIQSD